MTDDDDDNENSFSIRKIKAETGFLNDEDSMDKIDAETASTVADNDVEDPASVVDQLVSENIMKIISIFFYLFLSVYYLLTGHQIL